MKPVTVVVSLPVMDLARSLRFYQDGLGLQTSDIDESIIAFELPNLSLFLVERGEYEKYTDRAGVTSRVTPVSGACILSCAMGSRKELDDVLERAEAAGGSTSRTSDDSESSYTGYVLDPDGHVWELVFNARTEAAAPS
jgi:predicted lactoylglutathione lyase